MSSDENRIEIRNGAGDVLREVPVQPGQKAGHFLLGPDPIRVNEGESVYFIGHLDGLRAARSVGEQ